MIGAVNGMLKPRKNAENAKCKITEGKIWGVR